MGADAKPQGRGLPRRKNYFYRTLTTVLLAVFCAQASAAPAVFTHTETFQNTAFRNTADTSADWNTDLGDLIIGSTAQRKGGFNSFSATTDLNAISQNFEALASGDFNGDGLQDIVAVTRNSIEADKILIRDTNGGTYSVADLHATEKGDSRSVAVGDLDRDGDLDIVVGRSNTAFVFINDGAGSFSPAELPVPSSTLAASVNDLALADVDSDGDLDIIAATTNVSGIAARVNNIYLNDGAAVFTRSNVSAVASTSFRVLAGDINGDKMADLIFDDGGAYLNDGSGGFNLSINSNLSISAASDMADIDGDGDLDVVSGTLATGNSNKTRAFFNSGSGVFQPVDVATSGLSTLSLKLVDVNQDGTFDIVEGAGDNSPVRLMSNRGDGIFYPPENIGTDTRNVSDLLMLDSDRDGDLDLLTVAAVSARIRLLSNAPGHDVNPLQNTASVSVIDATVNPTLVTRMEPAMAIAVGDLDLDGRDDMVVGGDGFLRVYYAYNSITGGYRSFTFASTFNVRDIELADFDLDGDLDMVVGNRNAVNHFYRNSNVVGSIAQGPFADWLGTTPTPVSPTQISADANDTRSIAVGDMNNDGYPDLIVGNGSSQINRWYPWPFSAGQVGGNITNTAADTRAIEVADFNQDGKLDVITGEDSSNGHYYRRSNSGFYSGVIVGPVANIREVRVADLNNDGAPDVVFANAGQNTFVLNNKNSSQAFPGTNGVIGSETENTTDIRLLDYDNDGDIDVISGSSNTSNKLYLNQSGAIPFTSSTPGLAVSANISDTRAIAVGTMRDNTTGVYNLVSANFNQAVRIALADQVTTSSSRLHSVSLPGSNVVKGRPAAGDVDNDGDMDIVVAYGNGYANRLLLNDGFGRFSMIQIADDGDTRSVALADVNKDGRLDLVTGNYGARNKVYLNTGTGNFFTTATDVTTDTDNTTDVAIGDCNVDGNPDIFVSNDGQTDKINPSLLLAPGVYSSSLALGAATQARGLAAGDIDGDGDIDAIVALFDAPNQFYSNNGNCTFSSTPVSGDVFDSFDVVLQDKVAGAGMKAIIANFGKPNRVYEWNGVSGFIGSTLDGDADNTRAVAIADFNTDAVEEVISGNAFEFNRITGAGFGNLGSAANNTIGLLVADIDGDSAPDVVEINTGAVDKLYLSGQRFDTRLNTALSTTLATNPSVIQGLRLDVTLDAPANTDVDYYLSSNDGATWTQAYPGEVTALRSPGTQPRWKAVLSSQSPQRTPAINDLNLTELLRLNASVPAHGRITSDQLDCGVDCEAYYESGTDVLLTAVADANYRFSSWTGDCAGAVTTGCLISIDLVNNVGATFVPDQTLDVSVSGRGIVTSDTGGINCGFGGAVCSYDYGGELVELTATPQPGWFVPFIGMWSGCDSAGGSSCQVTMDQAKSVTATFSATLESLWLNLSSSNVTITSSDGLLDCGPNSSDCEYSYDHDSQVTLLATPINGYEVSEWTGACAGITANTCILTLDDLTSDTTTVDVNVVPQLKTLSVSNTAGAPAVYDNGLTPLEVDCGVDCSGQFNYGSTASIIAPLNDSQWRFTGWSGCDTTSGNQGYTCNILMDGDKAISASYVRRYQLTVTSTYASGTATTNISTSPAGIDEIVGLGSPTKTAWFDENEAVTVTVTPLPGNVYVFGGDCSGTNCVTTLSSNRSVTVDITAGQFDITVIKAGSGSGVVSSDYGAINCGATCVETYVNNSLITLTAAPSAGSVVSSWAGVSCEVGSNLPNQCQVLAGPADKIVTVTFVQAYPLSVSKSGTGDGVVSSADGGINCNSDCGEDYAAGTQVTLSANPNGGNLFIGWSGSSCSGTGTCVVTMDAAKTVNAEFDILRYLSLDIEGTGIVTLSPAGEINGLDTCNTNTGSHCEDGYTDGTSVTLSAVVPAGQVFVRWTGACSAAGTASSCTIAMTGLKSVTAEFDINGPTLTVTAPVGGGTVSSQPVGIDCLYDCRKNFQTGASVVLTAHANSNRALTDWGIGECPDPATSCTVIMNFPKTVSPIFSLDSDADGIADVNDNCPGDANADQADSNADGEGDVCDADSDSDLDTIIDNVDNCPADANTDQADNNGFEDGTGKGDACETLPVDNMCFPVKSINGNMAVICL